MNDERSVEQAAEHIREEWRKLLRGDCRWLSLGTGCTCVLCDVDRLVTARREAEAKYQESEHAASRVARKYFEQKVRVAEAERQRDEARKIAADLRNRMPFTAGIPDVDAAGNFPWEAK